MRNPKWSRDEHILALDLYFRHPDAIGSKTHPEVIKLSELLNRMPDKLMTAHEVTYRNPSGVGMKLSNYLVHDPSYSGTGLQRGSKLEKEVWDEFAHDKARLRRVAESIRANILQTDITSLPASHEQEDEQEATEGDILTRVHKYRERDPKIVTQKKKTVLKAKGALECEACGFDFAKYYGSERGYGFAECHHDVPLSTLKPNQKTKIKDLRILCANCHRMIHRFRPWLTVGELVEVIRNRQNHATGQ